MRSLLSVQNWDGAVRLVGVVVAGMAVAMAWAFRNSDARWPLRLWQAALAALAPVLMVWPRRRRRVEKALCSSLNELEHLRRAGAI